MSKDETCKPEVEKPYWQAAIGHNSGEVTWTSLRAIVNTAAKFHQAAVEREKDQESDRAMAEVIKHLPEVYVKKLGFDKADQIARLEALGYKLS